MKTNVLKTLINLDNIRQNEVSEIYTSKIQINNVGVALEYYIKDLFSDSFNILDVNEKDKEHSKYMSYLGNQNNPPDFIIENGDAVEVKKIGSQGSRIALNSSYPKNKLYSDDPRITNACRECEADGWDEKDIIYTVGVVKQGKLKLVWFIYGDCYAADRQAYKGLADGIKESVDKEGYEFTETNELGKVKRVDPLGITELRIRGMWHIDNPLRVYEYVTNYEYDKAKDLSVFALMKKEKYNSFPLEDRETIENNENSNLNIKDVEIKSPNNPADYIDAKLIEGHYDNL